MNFWYPTSSTEGENETLGNERDEAREEATALTAELERARAQVGTLTAQSNAHEKNGLKLEAKLKLAQNQNQLYRMKLDQAAARGGGRPTGAGWAPRMTVFGAAQQKAVHGKVNVGKLDKDLKVNQEEMNDALADRIVIMTGWLEKRKKGVNNWKKRWFILKRNVLLYFKDETGTELKGVLFTDRLRVEVRRCPPTRYNIPPRIEPRVHRSATGAAVHPGVQEFGRDRACGQDGDDLHGRRFFDERDGPSDR